MNSGQHILYVSGATATATSTHLAAIERSSKVTNVFQQPDEEDESRVRELLRNDVRKQDSWDLVIAHSSGAALLLDAISQFEGQVEAVVLLAPDLLSHQSLLNLSKVKVTLIFGTEDKLLDPQQFRKLSDSKSRIELVEVSATHSMTSPAALSAICDAVVAQRVS